MWLPLGVADAGTDWTQGAPPATLAEILLSGGTEHSQNYVDISLVDGYNIPVGVTYIPSANTSFIPPNLSNFACIATPGFLYDPSKTGTLYSNSTFPIPWEFSQNNKGLRNWCPWDLLAFPPIKPGDGVYPYPDDDIHREDFSPCRSRCDVTRSDSDCCVNYYNNPNVCKASDYSHAAKAACPDAYSFAYDDQQSTFILPHGGGWQVTFCPEGRSTNILRTLGPELREIASAGKLSKPSVMRVTNATYIVETNVNGARRSIPVGLFSAVAVAGLLSVLLIA